MLKNGHLLLRTTEKDKFRLVALLVGETRSLLYKQPEVQSVRSPDVLRTVPDEKAFHFYKGMDQPLGVKANNLEEFVEKLNKINDLSCIEFHAQRHDFENWIKMLGDTSLANQIASAQKRSHSPEVLRQRLAKTVEVRLESLKNSHNRNKAS